MPVIECRDRAAQTKTDDEEYLPGSGEWVDPKTAVDHLEPLEDTHSELRDAGLRAIEVLQAFAGLMERRLGDPNVTVRDVALAFWKGAYALGLQCCAGVSMTDRAQLLGCERASISKGATSLCSSLGLAPSFYMKREGTAETFAKARIQSIAKQNGALPHVPPAGRSV
jgi:hypothetical protein